jgi:hypothetical protein
MRIKNMGSVSAKSIECLAHNCINWSDCHSRFTCCGWLLEELKLVAEMPEM